ncbi:TonB-dependent receptor [Rhodohalobacter sp.]|uniref:SusC/RagA family TonB-linked outer membrane protein n=1 Tax=Rhodohalobacter sp. TaxID=1974210 RepID=UPI002ACD6055|nr:TonB-dependent receptor [Rhodohalobacter sp.]MDZ7757307.1 TonB-dependent receptor [Rhodohalobacter sp.]
MNKSITDCDFRKMMRVIAVKTFFMSFALLSTVLFQTEFAIAQQTVTGTVVDAQSGETLPGVNIRVKGSDTRGTVTDFEGNFTLTLQPDEQILVFSYVGYIAQEITIDGREEFFIELEPSIGELDELVVIGYGSVRKRDVTGAIGQVSAEEIGKITSLNAEQSLQGKVSGVQITTTSGAPGAGAAVRIRGVGTFNNSSPIYVVDGVIIDDISFLNPADIQSMEVLKDASATAIYGSRGANGVILVQTKTGAGLDGETLVSVSIESGIQQLENKIDLLDGREFAIIANEIRAGSYNNVDLVPNTDWQDLIFDVAPIQNHQISVSGASENSDYYVSLGYFQQGGIIEKSNFERLNLKINNNYNISESVKLGNNLTISPYKQRVAPNVTFAAYRAQPLLEPFYDDGSYGVVFNVGNPLADLENSNNFNSGVRVVGNVFGEFTIANDLMLRSSFGTDAALNRGKSFTPAFTVFNPDGSESQQNNEFSDLFKSEGINYNLLWENTANYIKEINEKHQVNAVAGITIQQTKSEILQLSGQNVIRDGEEFWYMQPSYIIDEANNINMLSSIFNGVDPNQFYNMISYLGRVVYSYNDKYTTTLTLRRDGSSKFSEENRWGTFPSVAFGWNIDREAFMQDVTLINNLKLRASWGKIGNEKISYYDRFARVNSNLVAVFGNPDATYIASTYGQSGNPDLKWETTTQTDVGLEIGLLDNRLSGEFDFYNRVTDDILVELSTPGHLGNGQGQRVRFNAASILNRGVEFRINWRDYIGDFSYGLTVLGNTVHNEVQTIGGISGVDDELIGGFLANGQSVTRSVIGRPIGSFFGYKTDGIFQNQAELDSYPSSSQAGVGDLRFVDINGDGQINGDDRTYLGSPIPKFVYGFSVDLDYKNWDFSVGFQGQYGNKIFNGKNVVRPDPYNFEQHVWNRWTGEGTSDTEPRPSYGGYNFLPSDRFISDGSYLRLRSLNIGYSIPSTIANAIQMARARIYVKATNLFTWTEYSGYTPEIGSGNVLSNGIDTGVYPIPRVISIGINTTF